MYQVNGEAPVGREHFMFYGMSDKYPCNILLIMTRLLILTPITLDGMPDTYDLRKQKTRSHGLRREGLIARHTLMAGTLWCMVDRRSSHKM